MRVSDMMTDPEVVAVMLRLADDYDKLADRARVKAGGDESLTRRRVGFATQLQATKLRIEFSRPIIVGATTPLFRRGLLALRLRGDGAGLNRG